jgi:hypothetical protein
MRSEDEGGAAEPREPWVRTEDDTRTVSRGPTVPGQGVQGAGEARMTPRGGGEDRSTPRGEGDASMRRDPGSIRAEDTEPYVGLQYVARLFKIVAMIVIVAIIAEVVAGLVYEGAGAMFNLLAEVIQGGVLAAMLWGAGDLTLLFIDVGHDVRAARVLLGRMSARMGVNAGEFMPRRDRDGDDEPAHGPGHGHGREL